MVDRIDGKFHELEDKVDLVLGGLALLLGRDWQENLLAPPGVSGDEAKCEFFDLVYGETGKITEDLWGYEDLKGDEDNKGYEDKKGDEELRGYEDKQGYEDKKGDEDKKSYEDKKGDEDEKGYEDKKADEDMKSGEDLRREEEVPVWALQMMDRMESLSTRLGEGEDGEKKECEMTTYEDASGEQMHEGSESGMIWSRLARKVLRSNRHTQAMMRRMCGVMHDMRVFVHDAEEGDCMKMNKVKKKK
jgi:hypothetical protein